MVSVPRLYWMYRLQSRYPGRFTACLTDDEWVVAFWLGMWLDGLMESSDDADALA